MDPDSKRLPPRRHRRSGEPDRTKRPGLTVVISDGRGRPVTSGGLARWLAGVAPARARGEVAVALVPDARVRALNRKYRQTDAATDVLSFAGSGPRQPRTVTCDLGDIVIATGVARRQARAAGHPYSTELRVLALHGLLHLLGFDHHDSSDNGRMARTELRLRRKGGLGAGLIERSRP